ncbi:hypothetical protein [Timonella senegalensis]|uniref:hypothetical protein n=1 Tax=Timonella senegalensis TaxID=1465825 RepID=UPI002FDDCA09
MIQGANTQVEGAKGVPPDSRTSNRATGQAKPGQRAAGWARWVVLAALGLVVIALVSLAVGSRPYDSIRVWGATVAAVFGAAGVSSILVRAWNRSPWSSLGWGVAVAAISYSPMVWVKHGWSYVFVLLGVSAALSFAFYQLAKR